VDCRRRGIALVIVLALLLVLAVFGTIVRLLSHAAYKELDAINAHLRAIAVGEVGFATVTARLTSSPWSRRWFAKGPEVQRDVKGAGGTYSYLIRDTSRTAGSVEPADPIGSATSHLADLLISATYERSSVVMFWRLMVPEDSLDSVSRVVPSFFTLPQEASSVTRDTADIVSAQVDQAAALRAANSRDFEPLYAPLRAATDVREVETTLGFAPPGVLQEPQPADDSTAGVVAAGLPAGNQNPADAVPVPTPGTGVSSVPGTTVTSPTAPPASGAPEGVLSAYAQDYLLPRLSKIKTCLAYVNMPDVAARVDSEISGLQSMVQSVDRTSTNPSTPNQNVLVNDSYTTISVATQQMNNQDPLQWYCP
jgi:hypothetical protein